MERKLYEYDYEKPELTDEFFEHHGIKGQKWGVRNGPPYPLNERRGGTIGESSAGHISKHKKRKLQKQRVKTLKKARKVRTEKLQEQKQTTKTKEEIIKTHDLAAMYKNRDLFTTQEINDLNNRYTAVQNLKKNLAQEMKANRTKKQKVADWVKDNTKEAGLNIAKKVFDTAADMAFKKLAASTSNTILTEAANKKTPQKKKDKNTRNGSYYDQFDSKVLDLMKEELGRNKKSTDYSTNSRLKYQNVMNNEIQDIDEALRKKKK